MERARNRLRLRAHAGQSIIWATSR